MAGDLTYVFSSLADLVGKPTARVEPPCSLEHRKVSANGTSPAGDVDHLLERAQPQERQKVGCCKMSANHIGLKNLEQAGR